MKQLTYREKEYLNDNFTKIDALKIKNENPQYECIKCGNNTLIIEYEYMLNDDLWAIISQHNKHICFYCMIDSVKLFLKRDIKKSDFKNVAYNYMFNPLFGSDEVREKALLRISATIEKARKEGALEITE